MKSFFGTAFFRSSDDTFQASPFVFIYVAAALPLTIMVIVSWLWWRKRRHARKQRDFEAGGISMSIT